MTPAERDEVLRNARKNPSSPKAYIGFAVELARWDNSHIHPVAEYMAEGSSKQQALEYLREDLENGRADWRRQHGDDLADEGARTNAQLDEAYDEYVKSYLSFAGAGAATRNPAGFKVGDRVRYTGPTNRELENGVLGKATRVSPKEREFTFLADGGSIWNSDGEEIRVSYDDAAHESSAAAPASGVGRRPYRQKNPGNGDVAEAEVLYERFHRYPPKDIGEFKRGFEIPTSVFRAGKAKYVTYRSSKVDPATLKKPRKPINYIHDHDAGVEIYLTETDVSLGEMTEVEVPDEFSSVQALCKLGDSLGYAFYVDDELVEAEGVDPLPELYCTPDGKCLLVIQDKREVIAMIWGGALGVFPRGIDG